MLEYAELVPVAMWTGGYFTSAAGDAFGNGDSRTGSETLASFYFTHTFTNSGVNIVSYYTFAVTSEYGYGSTHQADGTFAADGFDDDYGQTSWSVNSNSIYSTVIGSASNTYSSSSTGGTSVYTASGSTSTSYSGSFQINPFEANFTTGEGPVYYSNTTIVITDHIAGNETTSTTRTTSVISGTKTLDAVINELVPTSTSVQITVPTFTTISSTDSSTTTTFSDNSYSTTTQSAAHGTTFTRASYSCTPYIEQSVFKTDNTVFIPEANGTKEDWFWIFRPFYTDASDWTGYTARFSDFWASVDDSITVPGQPEPFSVETYPTFNSSRSSETNTFGLVAFSYSSSAAPDISITTESFVSVRYSDTALPTPDYTVSVNYHITQDSTFGESNLFYTFMDTAEAHGPFVASTFTQTWRVNVIPYTSYFRFRNSNSGLDLWSFTFGNDFTTETVEQTTPKSVYYSAADSDGSFNEGQTNTFFEAFRGGLRFEMQTLNPLFVEFTPTYWEGFQIQPRIAHTDPRYRFIDANLAVTLTGTSIRTISSFVPSISSLSTFAVTTTGGLMHEVCLGSKVHCPYNDEYIQGSSHSIVWDEMGQPSFTAYNSTGDIQTAEAFGGGDVGSTVMTVFFQSGDAEGASFSGRWRMGGTPRAGGNFSSYLLGGVEYTELRDGTTTSSTFTAGGSTYEVETSAHAAFMSFGIYQLWTAVPYVIQDNQGIYTKAFNKHTSSYFNTV